MSPLDNDKLKKPDSRDNLLKELLLNEVAGKMTAIHAYDKAVWTIRSGYLTLFYGGWALITKSIIDSSDDIGKYSDIIIMMLLFSLCLSVGAFIIDRNYMQRKFRVINSVNEFYASCVSIESPEEVIEKDKKALKNFLEISGDKDNENYKIDGYEQACRACLAVYSFSVISILAAMVYFVNFTGGAS